MPRRSFSEGGFESTRPDQSKPQFRPGFPGLFCCPRAFVWTAPELPIYPVCVSLGAVAASGEGGFAFHLSGCALNTLASGTGDNGHQPKGSVRTTIPVLVEISRPLDVKRAWPFAQNSASAIEPSLATLRRAPVVASSKTSSRGQPVPVNEVLDCGECLLRLNVCDPQHVAASGLFNSPDFATRLRVESSNRTTTLG